MESKALEDLGLTKREAKCYLSLLELGPSTIGDIVKKSEIPSSKIYEVLDRLIAKSLANYVIKKNQKHFAAAEPEAILNSFEEKKKNFEEILPLLKEKQRFSEDKQFVELYEGKHAIMKLLRRLVDEAKNGDNYLSFSHGDEHKDDSLVMFYANLAARRTEKKLKSHVLVNKTYENLLREKYPKKTFSLVNPRVTDFHFPQGIIVASNNVVTINWLYNPTAIRIKSTNLADQYNKFFFELYDKAKPFYK